MQEAKASKASMPKVKSKKINLAIDITTITDKCWQSDETIKLILIWKFLAAL